ncbi:MAG: LacI family DNA-binding transcriptional regulator [Rhizobiaceae bacterium]
MKKRNLPTLEDVANAAEVSTATVSRCMNEPEKVTEKTRDRVMAAVVALNYAPNFGARAIAANRTGIFGVVIPTMENAIFARGVEAFQKVLIEKNATMLVASSDYDPEQEAKQIRTLVARGADGLMLIGFQRDPGIYRFLSEREIPVVSAWASSRDKSQSYVGFDNRTASMELVGRALSLGHTSIAYVSAPTSLNDRARERVTGAKVAIENAGLDPASLRVVETDYSIQNGKNAILEILQRDRETRPTLVICGNDVLGVGVIQAVKEFGLSVPDDISVLGFDDIELATVVSPKLTTVHVPHQEMGRIAAEILYSLVTESSEPRQFELETHIVERESLSTPPARKI